MRCSLCAQVLLFPAMKPEGDAQAAKAAAAESSPAKHTEGQDDSSQVRFWQLPLSLFCTWGYGWHSQQELLRQGTRT